MLKITCKRIEKEDYIEFFLKKSQFYILAKQYINENKVKNEKPEHRCISLH